MGARQSRCNGGHTGIRPGVTSWPPCHAAIRLAPMPSLRDSRIRVGLRCYKDAAPAELRTMRPCAIGRDPTRLSPSG